MLQPIAPVATAPAEPVAPRTDAKPLSSGGPVPVRAARSPLSFTDEDLVAIGPIVDPEVPVGLTPASPVRLTPAPLSPVIPIPAAAAPTPVEAAGLYDADLAVIAEAAECLLERTGLSRSDAMRLMEQEAADTGRKLIEVAQSVLGRDGDASGSGMALAS